MRDDAIATYLRRVSDGAEALELGKPVHVSFGGVDASTVEAFGRVLGQKPEAMHEKAPRSLRVSGLFANLYVTAYGGRQR